MNHIENGRVRRFSLEVLGFDVLSRSSFEQVLVEFDELLKTLRGVVGDSVVIESLVIVHDLE